MVLAAIDAVNAGRSASNFISPMTNTSIAKKTAAMGVPNNPEKLENPETRESYEIKNIYKTHRQRNLLHPR